MSILSALANGSLTINPVEDFDQLTAYPFMVHALEAGTIVAVMAGVVGWYMVLRRETFAGHTLSLMAFPGATGAVLIGLPAAVGYFTFCGVSAVVIGASAGSGARRHRGQESAVTGAVQAFGLACGFLFLSLYKGVLGGYENLLFGDFLGITEGQVLALAIVTVLALIALAVTGRPLLFASVDEEVARASGVPVRALSQGFLVCLGLAVAATAQITGVLLVFALLVAPAASAQLITARVGPSLVLTVAIGIVTTWVGLALAYFYNYPVGFYITSVAFGIYVIARVVRAAIDHPAVVRRGHRLAQAGEA
jgi:zinc/manganese transport system permease protein